MTKMRTARQIRRWLESHKWYGSFRTQVLRTFPGERILIERILSGGFGKDTISSGFDWWQSDEGSEYWIKIDFKFREWYEKESK